MFTNEITNYRGNYKWYSHPPPFLSHVLIEDYVNKILFFSKEKKKLHIAGEKFNPT